MPTRSGRRAGRGKDPITELVRNLLTDATHALITTYARRRSKGQEPRVALIEGLHDVVEQATGVRMVGEREVKTQTVVRRVSNEPDSELERIKALKKLINGA